MKFATTNAVTVRSNGQACILLGIGQFPVDKWEDEHYPVMSEKDWGMLCRAMALRSGMDKDAHDAMLDIMQLNT